VDQLDRLLRPLAFMLPEELRELRLGLTFERFEFAFDLLYLIFVFLFDRLSRSVLGSYSWLRRGFARARQFRLFLFLDIAFALELLLVLGFVKGVR